MKSQGSKTRVKEKKPELQDEVLRQARAALTLVKDLFQTEADSAVLVALRRHTVAYARADAVESAAREALGTGAVFVLLILLALFIFVESLQPEPWPGWPNMASHKIAAAAAFSCS